MIKKHILHCDGPHCPLKLHLIMPGQEATRVDSLIFCDACKPVEGLIVQEYPVPSAEMKFVIGADIATK